jgi:hypothetical protein
LYQTGNLEATGPVSGTAKFEGGIQSSLVSSEKGKAMHKLKEIKVLLPSPKTPG